MCVFSEQGKQQTEPTCVMNWGEMGLPWVDLVLTPFQWEALGTVRAWLIKHELPICSLSRLKVKNNTFSNDFPVEDSITTQRANGSVLLSYSDLDKVQVSGSGRGGQLIVVSSRKKQAEGSCSCHVFLSPRDPRVLRLACPHTEQRWLQSGLCSPDWISIGEEGRPAWKTGSFQCQFACCTHHRWLFNPSDFNFGFRGVPNFSSEIFSSIPNWNLTNDAVKIYVCLVRASQRPHAGSPPQCFVWLLAPGYVLRSVWRLALATLCPWKCCCADMNVWMPILSLLPLTACGSLFRAQPAISDSQVWNCTHLCYWFHVSVLVQSSSHCLKCY